MALRSLVVPGCLVAILLGTGSAARAYPTDEYERTGIKRLQYQYLVDRGLARGRRVDPGGQWPGSWIELKMLDKGRDFDLTEETPKDPQMQTALEDVLRRWSFRRYYVAILDITDPEHPRYAGVNDHVSQTPGSVAKVLVASGLFKQLAERYPDSIEKREEFLRTTTVSMDDWGLSDSHEVPYITGEKLDRASHRRIRIGDTFTLWEWLDHTLSASNNSAAATTWREATLMKLMGKDYPPEKYDAELWKRWTKEEMTEASFAVVNEPIEPIGIDPEVFRLRLYFTRGANKYIKSESSGATPFTMVKWMLRVEQGKVVDEWSSLELKKMLYLTKRRVRYLYTKKLKNFGGFFKSGSLYRFSEGAVRIQYQGDLVNVLNSLIEIDTTKPPPDPIEEMKRKEEEAKAKAEAEKKGEATADASKEAEAQAPQQKVEVDAETRAAETVEKKEKPYVYIVAVMSNELKRNAALDHSRLAEAIHDIVTAPKETAPKAPPAAPSK